MGHASCTLADTLELRRAKCILTLAQKHSPWILTLKVQCSLFLSFRALKAHVHFNLPLVSGADPRKLRSSIPLSCTPEGVLAVDFGDSVSRFRTGDSTKEPFLSSDRLYLSRDVPLLLVDPDEVFSFVDVVPGRGE